MKIFKEVNLSSSAKVEEIDENLIREFAMTCQGDICPIATVIGGIAAQEIMKVSYTFSANWCVYNAGKMFLIIGMGIPEVFSLGLGNYLSFLGMHCKL